jgi:diguanylate cyclase (GGDEF)-like protein
MLPDTPHDAAMEIAGQIRLSVVRAALLHAESPFKILTVSIGCMTAFPSDGGDALTVVNDADRALYAAKVAGRNCVMSLDGQSVSRAISGLSSV